MATLPLLERVCAGTGLSKRSTGVAIEVDLREHTLRLPPEKTLPEIQNRGISAPKVEHVYVSPKNILKIFFHAFRCTYNNK